MPHAPGSGRPTTPRTPGRTPGSRRGPHGPPPIDARSALELVSLVVAPTTLATALLYWFGFELVDARSSYFGLGTGTLGFSTTDYLVRGVEAGIVPLLVLFLAVLAAVALHVAVVHVADVTRGTARFPRGVLVALVLSCGVSVVAVYGVFRPLPSPVDWYLLPPLLMAVGPFGIVYTSRLLRHTGGTASRMAQIANVAVAGLIVLSLFWQASLYADALGRGRAQALGRSLASQPRVTIYSQHGLSIDPRVATAERLASADSARFAFRYSGFRLLVRSDNKYFLLPDGWNPATGVVLVLRDTSDIRLEFAAGGR